LKGQQRKQYQEPIIELNAGEYRRSGQKQEEHKIQRLDSLTKNPEGNIDKVHISTIHSPPNGSYPGIFRRWRCVKYFFQRIIQESGFSSKFLQPHPQSG
jgi:hypothetical protein